MAIKQLRKTKSKIGQALRIQIYKSARQLQVYSRKVIVWWILINSGIKKNKQVDKTAKEAVINSRA